MVGDSPVIDLGQIIFVDEIGEGLAPVVPYFFGGGGASGYEFGEMRDEIVAAALLKLGGEVGGPVGTVGFEGVGEDGVGWGVAEGFDERFTYLLEVGRDGLVAEGVEDVAFGSYGGAFDLLFGMAGDEEEGDAGFVGWRDVAALGWDGLGRGWIPCGLGWCVAVSGCGCDWAAADISIGEATVLGCADGEQVDDGGGDDGITLVEGGRNGDEGVRGDGNFDGAETAGGFGEGGGGTAVGPAAAESDIDAEAELAAFGLGVADGVEHGRREEGEVDEILCGVVEDLGIDEGKFGSADAVGFHLLEFAENLGFFHSGAEPPPADHGPCVGWGILKAGLERFYWGLGRKKGC